MNMQARSKSWSRPPPVVMEVRTPSRVIGVVRAVGVGLAMGGAMIALAGLILQWWVAL